MHFDLFSILFGMFCACFIFCFVIISLISKQKIFVSEFSLLKNNEIHGIKKDFNSIIYKLNSEIDVLKKSLTDHPPASHSIELSEFLNDVNRYGYSYTRVSPNSIMVRSPRDKE